MGGKVLLILASVAMAASAWSIPYYPVQRAPLRFTRYAPAPPHFRQPIPVPHHITRPIRPVEEEPQRPKREHDDYGHDDYGHDGHDSHDGHDNHNTRGVTGPVHTFVKTDKNANYKWGVRHHVGNKYAS